MKALLLERYCNLDYISNPLEEREIPIPVPQQGELLVKISACGICHTEIDEIEGRMPPPSLPVILGHQVGGRCGASRRAS